MFGIVELLSPKAFSSQRIRDRDRPTSTIKSAKLSALNEYEIALSYRNEYEIGLSVLNEDEKGLSVLNEYEIGLSYLNEYETWTLLQVEYRNIRTLENAFMEHCILRADQMPSPLQ